MFSLNKIYYDIHKILYCCDFSLQASNNKIIIIKTIIVGVYRYIKYNIIAITD